MERMIECVPNFSEGRNRETIDAIVAAIASVDAVRVLRRPAGSGDRGGFPGSGHGRGTD